MLNRFIKTFIGVALSASLGLAQAPAPQVKDQQEYDMITAADKEKDPAKKLVLLDQWAEKYADTQFKQKRNLDYVQAYSTLAAGALTANATPEARTAGQKAASTMIEKADTFFSADMKPPNVADDAWGTAKQNVIKQAHATLAAVAMANKDFGGSEAEYRKLLELSPNDAQTAYQLGLAIASQKKVERTPEAIFYFARSVTISGQGALDDATKKATDAYLQRAYKNYHGSVDDLDKVREAAKAPTMPAGFDIESITVISQRQNQSADAFAKAHPDIMKWRGLKDQLTAATGDDLFKQMKDAEVPDLKGHVVDQPTEKELTVSMDYVDPALAQKAEATLRFDPPLKCKVEAGTELTFAGIPISYAKEPFMITMDVERDKVKGLPEGCAAVEKKKSPVKKKSSVVKKKK